MAPAHGSSRRRSFWPFLSSPPPGRRVSPGGNTQVSRTPGTEATRRRRPSANVLSHQSTQGDWPKNIDTSASRYEGDRSNLTGTFDNGATVGEVRFLARAFKVTGRPADREAFDKAIDHILAAQYPNGGWPQTYPPGKGYARYITFNDNTMVNLLELLRDVARPTTSRSSTRPGARRPGRALPSGDRVRPQMPGRGQRPVDRLVRQHDEKTLEPREAPGHSNWRR